MIRFKSFINFLSMMIIASCLSISSSIAFSSDGTKHLKVKSVEEMTKVNINQANEKELVKNLNGIGSSKAKAIIEYREKNGGFKSIEELAKIKGIGQKIIEKNKERLTI